MMHVMAFCLSLLVLVGCSQGERTFTPASTTIAACWVPIGTHLENVYDRSLLPLPPLGRCIQPIGGTPSLTDVSIATAAGDTYVAYRGTVVNTTLVPINDVYIGIRLFDERGAEVGFAYSSAVLEPMIRGASRDFHAYTTLPRKGFARQEIFILRFSYFIRGFPRADTTSSQGTESARH
jgi:hypothetical protein